MLDIGNFGYVEHMLRCQRQQVGDRSPEICRGWGCEGVECLKDCVQERVSDGEG